MFEYCKGSLAVSNAPRLGNFNAKPQIRTNYGTTLCVMPKGAKRISCLARPGHHRMKPLCVKFASFLCASASLRLGVEFQLHCSRSQNKFGQRRVKAGQTSSKLASVQLYLIEHQLVRRFIDGSFWSSFHK